LKVLIPLGNIKELLEINPVLEELKKDAKCIKVAIGNISNCEELERITEIYTRIEVQHADSGVLESQQWGMELFCLTQEIEEINPERILILGIGRHMFSAATVGAHLNIPVIRIESAEVNSPMEMMFRDSSIKFAHMHIVANQAQRERLLKLGEDEYRIFNMIDKKLMAKTILSEQVNIQKIIAY